MSKGSAESMPLHPLPLLRAGVECRRFFVVGVRVVRLTIGVSPVEDGLSTRSFDGPGSENRTRFFALVFLLGVDVDETHDGRAVVAMLFSG